jgi:Sel1 repeat
MAEDEQQGESDAPMTVTGHPVTPQPPYVASDENEEAENPQFEVEYRRAEAGDTPAMFNLGVLLYKRGNRTSDEEAETWFRRAAEAGHTDAMYALGGLLELDSTTAAQAEAPTWFRRAAEAGHLEAMYALAGLLERRKDEASKAEAETWLRAAKDASRERVAEAQQAVVGEAVRRAERSGSERPVSSDRVRISADVPERDSRTLASIAARTGYSKVATLMRAIRALDVLEQARARGARVIIEESDGRHREILNLV